MEDTTGKMEEWRNRSNIEVMLDLWNQIYWYFYEVNYEVRKTSTDRDR